MSVLYITQNGVTDHIGRSQVAPYVLGLARAGFRIHVLSAEKLGQDTLITRYQTLFDSAGVRWTRVPYRNRPALIGQAWTQALMKRAAHRIIKQEEIRLVHCRSFPPALIAHQLKYSTGIKYIFDFRDFYADGGLEKTRGLARLVFRRLKRLEKPLIRNADKVVCLTERARDVLAEWHLNDLPRPNQRFQIIPCCADFDHFDASRITDSELSDARTFARIKPSNYVILYLGSLGEDYLLPQMIALFRQALLINPSSIFLFVSNNGVNLVEAEFKKQEISPEFYRFVSADRDQIPSLIKLANMSVFFYRPGLRSTGCSPTKLAELLACNIPVIANAGVGDLDKILNFDKNGSLIVEDFSESNLASAVHKMMNQPRIENCHIRENSRAFSLEVGVARYAEVYKEMLN